MAPSINLTNQASRSGTASLIVSFESILHPEIDTSSGAVARLGQTKPGPISHGEQAPLRSPLPGKGFCSPHLMEGTQEP